MKEFSIEEIKEYSSGKILKQNYNTQITNISIDSRNVDEKTLFIPIIGEVHDGHKFMESAYENGCRIFLIDKNHKFEKEDITLIEVEDTTIAFGYIAKGYKNRFSPIFIGVTGSVGKTTTKDMIFGVVNQKYKAFKNEGNFNNIIGVPKTLLRLEGKEEVAVIEMGMGYKGEIKHLANIVEPKIGIISNIGMSHIEHFDNQDGIFNAKMEITTNFNKDNLLIVNGDDKYLKNLKNKEYKVVTYGFNDYNDIFPSFYKLKEDSSIFRVTINDVEEEFEIFYPAKHNILNALAAILVGLNLDMSIEEIRKGLKNFELTKNRLDIIDNDKYRIINDTYNASKDSMISGIDVLSNYNTRKVAILGDIFELGKYSKEVHESIGKYIDDKKIDLLVTIGNESKYIFDNANIKNKYYFKEKEQFYKEFSNIIKEKDTILVKASNGMKLIEVVDYIKAH